eukprot:TRINITY_DN13035_c1_g4_i1.p1 TRINITY_DN13035_c1_g4~~TRINITY_DN13035_c1_g4_i1.p1  ORF type:complete len:570 (-),score=64.97 TRINITY_DN13035_c1_g4_i1:41-1750(-)
MAALDVPMASLDVPMDPTALKRSNTIVGLNLGSHRTPQFLQPSVEAFNIDRAVAKVAAPLSYTYKRSARGSIMLDLGIGPQLRRGARGDDVDSIDPYSKLSVEGAIWMYLAIVLGRGMTEIITVVSNCGYVVGVIFIMMHAWFHFFARNRLLEIPQLVEQNLETYTDIFAACISRRVKSLFTVTCVLNYFGMCLLFVGRATRNVILALKGKGTNSVGVPPEHYRLLTFMGVLFAALAFKNTSRDLQKAAKISLYCIVMYLVLEVSFAAYIGFIGCFEEDAFTTRQWTPIGDFEKVMEYPADMLLAFSDGGVLPFIVADMLSPEESKAVTKAGAKWMVVVYSVVGVTCYFGWADFTRYFLEKNMVILKNVQYLPECYFYIVRFMGILLAMISLAAYQMLFYPMLREVEHFLAFENSPAIQAGLPWAIQAVKWKKRWLRFGLVFLTVLPYYFNDWIISIIGIAYKNVFLLLVEFFFPSLLAIASALVHLRIVACRRASADDSAPRPNYMGGRLITHIIACTLYFLLGLYVCFSWLDIGIRRLQYEASLRDEMMNGGNRFGDESSTILGSLG